jgi:hypothetical protein
MDSGDAVITASAGTAEASVTFHVRQEVKDFRLPDSLTLMQYHAFELPVVDIVPENAWPEFAMAADEPEVLLIDEHGILIGRTPGETYLNVTSWIGLTRSVRVAVLPFEAELKAEAKKRQGQRNDLLNIPRSSTESPKQRETREKLAAMAGVSRDSISKTKQILAEADEETKEKLRKGEMSINRAYTSLKEKTDTAPKRPDLLPGYGLVKDMPPMKEGAYVRPPDSVYDTPPISVYGNMPADDMERRGIAEIAHVKSDMNECMAYCVRKVSEIMRDMTAASVNEQNIDTLKKIVTSGYDEIINLLNRKLLGGK